MAGTRVSMEHSAAPPPAPLAGYDPAPFWDEAVTAQGLPRPHYRVVLEALARQDLEARRAEVAEAMRERGVVFGGTAGTRPFVVDPVPRVLGAGEWSTLERGLAQRVRALNDFLADVYGEQAIVREGVVPARVIERADHFEPRLRGRVAPANRGWANVAGLDLVRGAAGEWAVLEDNLRTPSGAAYVLAAREGVAPGVPGEPRPIRAELAALLGDALRDAAPAGRDDPFVVLVSDGPTNSAYWEHSSLAELLEIPVVTLSELEHGGGELLLRPGGGGTPRRVDVVYRRTDEDRLTDERGALTAVGEALLEPWAAGRIGLVNAFGTGVADDKLAHAYVESMVRFYLGEEPLLPSVQTYDLGDARTRATVLDRLDELVVKPRSGYGGQGVVLCAFASERERRETREAVIAAPEDFVAQELFALSRHPTVIDGTLQPRHVDLRPFVYCGESVRVLPGGLTRVALDAGTMVVNSSQNGGGKDTWVMS